MYVPNSGYHEKLTWMRGLVLDSHGKKYLRCEKKPVSGVAKEFGFHPYRLVIFIFKNDLTIKPFVKQISCVTL